MPEYEIVWKGEPHPELEGAVREEVEQLKEAVEVFHPSNIITCTVILTEDDCGPSIHVWGRENDDRIHCEYLSETKWVTLDDADRCAECDCENGGEDCNMTRPGDTIHET